ncbi:putative peptidoglycan binding protein [Kitasatospora sp. SolWspMP-SS2h]|uniref:peptidoglycan binding domain-containing protein n=1 Tax=Kitasatospora sp. SolWspMP-SS2h TaxID=1305729 RepID=UPI000DBAD075|nr:peptidoglycan binding domain-containing protein [Kitasatospora sp. SolWspMP-SS2h]RAJ41254.1 putative peptidoglycan binding protein [Kitasatospora sp. SolWspMP-SS2h]
MSSRESDNAHPQPRRGGPDAYPSGTPPYGTGLPGGHGADPAAGRTAPGPRSDEAAAPKTTETTLTTRVRINIPGSRPIPPVVVQSKVKDEPPAEPPGPRHRGGAGDPVLGVMDGGARAAVPPTLPPEWQEPSAAKAAKPSESESTGEWFKPRQKGRPEPAPAAAPAGPVQGAPGAQQAARQPAPRPSGAPASPFAPADPAASSRTGGHPLPHQGEPLRAAAAAAPDPFAPDQADQAAQDPFAQDPFAAQQPRRSERQQPQARQGGPQDPFAQPQPQPQSPQPPRSQQPQQPQQQPGPSAAAAEDPFTAPHPGQGRPRTDADPFAATDPFATEQFAADPFATAAPGPRGGERPEPPQAAGEPEDTQIGGFDPITGDEPAPGAGISDPPTTQLFLKSPDGGDPFAEEPRPRPAGEGGGRFADLPAAQPFPGGSRAATPKREPSRAPAPDAPAESRPPAERKEPAPAAKKKGGRGRKLLVTGLGAVLFLGAAAYGAGLMMNQSDIPKGTTVLGTDIGGDSRDQAVTALDGSVGKAGQQPLKVKIGDQSVTLDPASAGLSFDTTATVDALTKHSYNPVEVLGSLTGGAKAVEPVVRVDRAKLKAALDDLGAKSGQSLQEGYVRFTEAGGTEVVPGAGGKALDSAAAADLVEQAYRGRAAGRADAEVALPVADAQPKVGQDVLQAAADNLGKQVLNGNVTVTSGTKQFAFGRNTAAKALVLAPDASGTVVLKWDLDKLSAAVGTTFDKLKTTRNGQQTAITPQDVADAIAQGVSKTGKDRTVKIPA